MKRNNAEKVYEESIKTLSVVERLWLVEKIISELRRRNDDDASHDGNDWRAVEGIAPGLMNGEDAQEWITRTRRDSDIHRESLFRADR